MASGVVQRSPWRTVVIASAVFVIIDIAVSAVIAAAVAVTGSPVWLIVWVSLHRPAFAFVELLLPPVADLHEPLSAASWLALTAAAIGQTALLGACVGGIAVFVRGLRDAL